MKQIETVSPVMFEITEIEGLEMRTDFGQRAVERIVSELTAARDYAESRSKFS